MLEYASGSPPPLCRTAFEGRLAGLDARLTLPTLVPWKLIFREYRTGLIPDDSLWVVQVAEPAGVDNVTGNPMEWRGRRWMLSSHMTDMEIMQTALKAYLTAVEHEVREQLLVDGVAVFDPHWSLDNLVVFGRQAGNHKER